MVLKQSLKTGCAYNSEEEKQLLSTGMGVHGCPHDDVVADLWEWTEQAVGNGERAMVAGPGSASGKAAVCIDVQWVPGPELRLFASGNPSHVLQPGSTLVTVPVTGYGRVKETN